MDMKNSLGILSVVFLALLGLGLPMTIPNKVAASGTIYITADGSIQPIGSPIVTLDKSTYTLSGNIYDPIIVLRNDLFFDGTGYSIQGRGGGSGAGITLQNVQNVTIMHVTVKAFTNGVRIMGSSKCRVLASDITSNSMTGIDMLTSNETAISDNNIIANEWYGLSITNCLDSDVSGNHVTSNGMDGIWIQNSPFGKFRNNVMENNLNLGITGPDLSSFINDIDTSNTIYGKEVYYLVSQQNLQIDSAAYPNIGYIGIINSTNVTVSNMRLDHNGQGALFAYTNDSTLEMSDLTNNEWGVTLFGSRNNSICRNNISENKFFGVEIDSLSYDNTVCESNIQMSLRGVNLDPGSSRNRIIANNITQNLEKGVEAYASSNNVISDNTIAHNGNGIVLTDSSNNEITGNYITKSQFFGIVAQRSSIGCSNNTISLNIFAANSKHGLHLEDSNTNHIFSNNITDNGAVGIYLRRSSGNMIYQNNFIGNPHEADSTGCVNTWDDSVNGNFWDNYNGTGTEPYVIDANNRDNHPLTQVAYIPEFSFYAILLALVTVIPIFLMACRKRLFQRSFHADHANISSTLLG